MQTEELRSSVADQAISKAQKRIFLDVGAGTNTDPGWTRMDSIALPNIDIVHNLIDFPWPFEDESVWHIRAVHVLEHIPMTCVCCVDRPDPLLQIFDEFWRVLTPGGAVRIVCPYGRNISRAWRDPTHRRAITEETFNYCIKAMREKWGVAHYPISCDFTVTWGYVIDDHGEVQDLNVELTKPA